MFFHVVSVAPERLVTDKVLGAPNISPQEPALAPREILLAKASDHTLVVDSMSIHYAGVALQDPFLLSVDTPPWPRL
eukprot:2119265-Alexandrium_andersonii.AAC.1